MDWYFIILFGLLFGCLATMGGIGGGVFFVPIMVFFMDIPMNIARNISSFAIFFNALVGSYSYIKQKRVLIRTGIVGGIGAIIGILIYNNYFTFLRNDQLIVIFGCVLMVISLYYLYSAITNYKKSKSMPKQENRKPTVIMGERPEEKDAKYLLKAFPLFALGGFLAALMGIGGGVIYTPTNNLLLFMPIHYATATSTFIILFTSGMNVILAIISGEIDYFIAILFSIGAVPGARIGAKLSAKVPQNLLKGILSGIMFFVGIRMLFP